MKKTFLLNIICLFLFYSLLSAQNSDFLTDKESLLNFSNQKASRYKIKKNKAVAWAKLNGYPVQIDTNGRLMEIQYIDEFGKPQYYISDNYIAAATISTDKLYTGGSLGLNLDGSGITIREWDGGGVRLSHQEYGGRVVMGDGTTGTHYHSTHVAGTIMASGVIPAARGMAYNANLRAFDWNNDNSEMATEAVSGALISNHSYGWTRGWYWTGLFWAWNGTPSISNQEDYLFGFYDSSSRGWDIIADNAPYYLIVKSAGNDRNEGPNSSPPNDGQYDCIGQQGISKNVLTVGAVDDILGGYSGPSSVVMSSFSSWGPADDGRIKPDIVANGIGLYSTYDNSDIDYNSISGTSMATPSVTGSLALLQEHWEGLNGAGNYMLSSTLKALVIHTADEAGLNDGPDYEFGWGLMNTETAAIMISDDQVFNIIDEITLTQGNSYSRSVYSDGTEPLKITICWTDEPGTPVANQLDPINPMLVNDLDLGLIFGATTYYPWKLDRDNPSNAATNNSENNVDNIEVVYIDSPAAGDYTIAVDHDGTLSGGSQLFSIIISGISQNNMVPEANFIADNTTPEIGQPVSFTDLSLYSPTSWSWSISPYTFIYTGGTNASSQNPQIQFNDYGYYTVTLVADNAYGSDTETKTNYIHVIECSYCPSIGNMDWATGTTLVDFNTINNATVKTSAYNDYTAISTGVVLNNSYNLTVNVNTDGPYTVLTFAWIDWNQDCDFNDPGEEYDLGWAWNVSDGATSASPLSITVPFDAVVGTTKMRVSTKFNFDPTSCELGYDGEVEDYTIEVLPRELIWTGNTSIDWDVASNWDQNTIPTVYYNVVIPTTPLGGLFPEISTATMDAQCYDMDIESGAILTIYGALTVTGTLINGEGVDGIIVKSDGSQTGSLITSTEDVEATVERYLTDGAAHFIGASVKDAVIGTLFFNHNPKVWLYQFHENDESWEYLVPIDTPMPNGKGYYIWVDNATKQNVTADFSGPLRSSDLTLNSTTVPNINFTDAAHGLNFVSNPFPCPLDWDIGSWQLSNIDGTVWVWSHVTGNYLYRNQMEIGNLTDGIIPVSQGFFIQANTANPVISIPTNARVHSAQQFYKQNRKPHLNTSLLVIEVSDDEKKDEIWIVFNKNCTKGYDNNWDVRKKYGDEDAPQISLPVSEFELSVNAIPELPEEGKMLPISFLAGESGQQKLVLKEFVGLEEVEVVLEDLFADYLHVLSKDSLYVFDASVSDPADRFLLHIGRMVTYDEEIEIKTRYSIYSYNKTVYIKSVGSANLQNITVQLFDIYGRIISEKSFAPSELYKLNTHINNNIVIVRLIEKNGQVYSEKVFIK